MKRILFVDDEQNILDGLRNLLWKYRSEMNMVFALGGETALEQLSKAPFDVIVSDMRMPGMDGATLLQRVKKEYPEIVRIVLSGHADQEAIFRALPVAHQFLSKPCDAEKLCNVIERACRLRALLSDESLRKAVGGIEKLPSLHTTYHELMRAMAQPDASARTIAGIVQRDPAMCAKLLQLVNSACFGPSKSVTGIDRAVAYLGMELIKNLALTVNVFAAIEQASSSSGVSFEALQEHSLLTARIASRLLPDPQKARDAFTAGLLHDVGNVALKVCFQERLKDVVDTGHAVERPAHQTGAEVLDTTHADVGAYLLGLWGLPYPIVETVAYHHHPAAAAETTFDLVSATHVADALADEAMGNAAGLMENPEVNTEHLKALNVVSKIPEWTAIAAEEVQLWRMGN
jgi:HD-like signal output (HDOD) protein